MHKAVAQWAAETPDAPAISCPDGTLTYRELDERANRLAHHLRSLGVAKDVVAAIHLDRNLDHYVALLAVLKAGGAALPLDTTYPTARLRFMLADSRAHVLITRQALHAELDASSTARAVVRVDADAADIAAHPSAPPSDETGPGDLAYVMYTSASTGDPKGVLLEHGGIANLCRWHIAALGLTSADCGSLAAPLSFDASILDLWPLLAAGGRTVAIDEESRTDLAGLVRALREAGVTVCFLTTALAELFLAQPGLEELPLRYLVTGGEALRRRPRPGLPFRLVNIYGPTETTVYVTSIVVAEQNTGQIPIGHAIGGVEVQLLGKDGLPVPAGEPGEVVVSGPGVARGYLGQPELTAKRFQTSPEARGYRTGDLARRRPDGALEFLGRLDRQVKVRGHRIEPEEMERVLLRHPAVRQAAVAAIRPTHDTAQLVAYIEAAEDRSPPRPAPQPAAPRGADEGALDTINALAPDSLLEIGAGIAGLGRVCGAHTRVDAVHDLTPAPRGGYAAVLIDCAAGRHGSLDELLAELVRAVELTADGGAVVVGGVRSLPLLAAAHGLDELAQAPDDMTTRELRWRVRGRLRAETGLAVHPAAFGGGMLAARTGRAAAVDVTPRYTRSGAPRYDVVIRIGAARPPLDPDWLDWTGDRLDLPAIRELLLAGEHRTLGVRAIPNALVRPQATAWALAGDETTAGEIRHRARAGEAAAPAPVDLLALAVGVPYQTRLSWAAARTDGSVDAVWSRAAGRPDIAWPTPATAPGALANRPHRAALDAALRQELHDELAGRFVAHEMPDLLVVLDRLPLTPVGKVDRNALPLPDWLSGARTTADAPRGAAEEEVAGLVAQVFGRTRVGRADDLVALGADSLVLAQLAARIAGRFGVDLPVRRLFAEPTVAAIAGRLGQAVGADPRSPKEVAA